MSKQHTTFISVDDLKLLVHKESGYKIQISDDDPILTTLYINKAVLGAALDEAGVLQQKAIDLIERLPGAADKEMKRAGAAAVNALSEEIGKIAKTVALESAAAERQKSFVWAVGSMTIFGTAMYAAGLVLGSQSAGGMGWGYLTAIAMAIGIVSGLLLFQVLIIGDRLVIKKKFANKTWTEQMVRETAKLAGMHEKLIDACVSVMTGDMNIVEAEKEHGLRKNSLQPLINRIENHR